MKKSLAILLTIVFQSCASSPRVAITSLPEGAVVSLKGADGSNRILGKTPLDLSSRELGGSQRLSSLEINAEGYQQQQILLARDRGSENFEVNVHLKKIAEDSKNLDARARQEKLARSIAQASNLINNKRFDEARAILSNITLEYPQVSVGYDLLGSLSFLQKDLKSALNYYEKALTINPESVDTRQMVNRLRGMLQ